ncbi:hypothetical protein DMN91_007923, partial [Ooceraea biroi]
SYLADSFHHYQTRHNLTTTYRRPLPLRRGAAVTARCPQQRHQDHPRAKRRNERWKWYRERRPALCEDFTESVESPWNFGRGRARVTVYKPFRDNCKFHFIDAVYGLTTKRRKLKRKREAEGERDRACRECKHDEMQKREC